MELWISILLSAGLLACAAGMIAAHMRSWRKTRNDPAADAAEVDFRHRQFLRRVQTSGMLAVLAVAILVGHWMTQPLLPHWGVLLYWAMVMGLVFWLALLALADVVATRTYYGRLHHQYQVQQLKLQLQARRIQRLRSNGHDDSGAPGED